MSGIILADLETIKRVEDGKAFAHRTWHRLKNKYPGYSWFIEPAGGVVKIALGDAGGHMGVVINYTKTATSSEVDRLIDMKVGELLERYRLKRGAADQNQIADARRDIAGRILFDR